MHAGHKTRHKFLKARHFDKIQNNTSIKYAIAGISTTIGAIFD